MLKKIYSVQSSTWYNKSFFWSSPFVWFLTNGKKQQNRCCPPNSNVYFRCCKSSWRLQRFDVLGLFQVSTVFQCPCPKCRCEERILVYTQWATHVARLLVLVSCWGKHIKSTRRPKVDEKNLRSTFRRFCSNRASHLLPWWVSCVRPWMC